MLHYTNAIMLLYVGRFAWCIYVFMYVLTSIFMQADRHKYVGVYIFMCVDRHA